ncbi:MAG: hypothetical protein K8R92_10150 [Planctomycetes bacterium]|nr:hypothetical protein [Planctomycetota bacterium]
MRPLTPGSVLSIRNVLAATTLLGCMSFAASAAPPSNPPSTPPANPNLGGPPVAPGASDSEKGFDGGKQGGKKRPEAGGPMGEERGKHMAWMRTFEEIKPTLSAEVQAKAEAIKAQYEASMKTWKDANADKLKALAEQAKGQGQKPDKATMEQLKALRESAPKPEESQKQIFALLTEPQQADFKTKLEANEKKMKALGVRRGEDEMGDGKGKGPGKGKGGPGGKPGDAPPADGKDKTPPPPPFDP